MGRTTEGVLQVRQSDTGIVRGIGGECQYHRSSHAGEGGDESQFEQEAEWGDDDDGGGHEGWWVEVEDSHAKVQGSGVLALAPSSSSIASSIHVGGQS
jgi:hypothetical protein